MRGARMLRTALGISIGAWLEDPAVIEVMLNPDGKLWVDRLGSGIADTGEYMSAQDGERIVRLVAHHVGVEVHGASPRVSAELPETGERFEGLLPPVVAAPTFAIRKPAVAVFTLDDYVIAGIMDRHDAEVLRTAVAERKNILVAGGTGTGKTTLVHLIPRLYDVTGGAVLVDGTDVRDLAPDELWSNIGLVPQEAFLFSGTIADNLRYGSPEATDDDLWHALTVAQARDFVAALPEGLNAPVAQGGTNFSGGQRQRLTIARALARRPAICLFDDSFSALDYVTDARLRAALAADLGGAAVLIVGQRVSSLRHADRIIALDHGMIVGQGSHEALMASSPAYREIAESQAVGEAA